jgi:pyruvate, water dikinase
MTSDRRLVVPFHELGRDDVARVGGKNASLGEMIRHLEGAGVRVPPGFATTADAYRRFLADAGLDRLIAERIGQLHKGERALAEVGRELRETIREAPMSDELAVAIVEAYRDLARKVGRRAVEVAVRSSATAEDLPEASFAGQQESYLNIRGEAAVLQACRNCFASLFTDRAISYREHHGFDHLKVLLSAGVQQMVRADQGGAGVVFTIDTETGFPEVVLITAAWGLGENVVQGTVEPDEVMVFKPLLDQEGLAPIIERRLGRKQQKMVYATGKATTRNLVTSRNERARFVLSEDESLQLARWAVIIERHYGMAMDIEWAKDGKTGELFVVQARPETVKSRRRFDALESYVLEERGKRLVTGLSIGESAATGKVCRLQSAADIAHFEEGGILVTANTDPDWVPIMKRAAAIVTDHGGRTSHAAIVSRELGLPAIVGTGDATRVLQHGQEVTVSCGEGDEGFVYEGIAKVRRSRIELGELPRTRTKVKLNLANPAGALRWWQLPSDGIGLARMEFIVGNIIRIHPMALARFDEVPRGRARREIERLTRGYADKTAYFVDHLARGIAKIAASAWPRPVIVRMSDFKTNEYARLIGGKPFEPHEENPMLGFRGASRYYSPRYREGFALECRAIRRVRETIGLDNVVVMIPFCRTVEEADRVLEVMAEHGLERGRNGLEVYVMTEIPSNVILAEDFAARFDGFSIGSNDLTQLLLGIDRDCEDLAALFDESNPAVTTTIRQAVEGARGAGRPIGLCGQAPSDHPPFARFLVECGIDSISVTPDSFVAVKRHVAEAEAELEAKRPARKAG